MAPAFLAGGGKMGERIRAYDWSATPLGPPDTWPSGLRTSVRLLLNTGHPMFIWWGPELIQFYNDAYRETMGPERHPSALGQRGRDCWEEIWHIIGPQIEQVMEGHGPTWHVDQLVPVTRFGKREEVYWTYSYGPIDDEHALNGVGGVLVVCTETTQTVLAERRRAAEVVRWQDSEARLRFLDQLSEHAQEASDAAAIMATTARMLGGHLCVAVCAYADMEADEDEFTIRGDWTAAGARSIQGTYRLKDFGARAVAELRAGRPLVSNDNARESPLFLQLGLYATICMPLIKHGKLTALMAVHNAAPRDWKPKELALLNEVTERCWAHIERIRTQEKLIEADRRKDEFLATLAHELRNPLAPIRQAARIAKSPTATEAQLRWSHDVIERQATHMAFLLDDLLDVSRITRGQLQLRKEGVELAAIVDIGVETARPLIDARGHELTVSLPTPPVRLEADALRLAQVISNLLTNAAKYTDNGGRIALSARIEDGRVVLRVRDSGIGIESHMLPRVFQMFSQATSALDRAEGGLGIGLALVKGLVELHGGTVEARSEGAGKGSEFIVCLPHAITADRQTKPVATAAPREKIASRRIVVADDNRDAANGLKMLLEFDGHTVETVSDGEQAIAAAAARPDVMIVDIGMPKLNGYEVARLIRQLPHGSSIKLVAMTGWGQSEDRERALQAGFDRHLTKPVDHAVLQSLLEQL